MTRRMFLERDQMFAFKHHTCSSALPHGVQIEIDADVVVDPIAKHITNETT